MIETEAYVLQKDSSILERKIIHFSDIGDDEVLALPVYGCFEANILHAVQKVPTNINEDRAEEEIVLGNTGVLYIQDRGRKVSAVEIGDFAIYFGNGISDAQGYPIKIAGYDAKGIMGNLAKKIKLKEEQVVKIPKNSQFSLKQWAAFSGRFISAYSNWRQAYGCWKIQTFSERNPNGLSVFAYGGGVSYAELLLAKKLGFNVYMTVSNEYREKYTRSSGIIPINRTTFKDFEKDFLSYISRETHNEGASIFIDNLGGTFTKIALKGLGRNAVISSCGWKTGSLLPISRTIECINRHIHVNTHYANHQEALDAINYAIAHNWMPIIDDVYTYCWEDIPQLILDYQNSKIPSYFPIYEINRRDELAKL